MIYELIGENKHTEKQDPDQEWGLSVKFRTMFKMLKVLIFY